MGAKGGSANGDLGHLLPEVAATIDRPVADRIWFAREDKWIGYERANEALAALRDLMEQPRQRRRRGMLLTGRPNNGKTTIIARFKEEHPVTTRECGEADCPVVVMQMPPEPSETRFWSELLLAMQIPHRDNDPVMRKKNQAVAVLSAIGCRVLVIDEVHNTLLGHAGNQRQMLGVLKFLNNDLWLPLVVAGTPDAIRAVSTDWQLSTRFKAFGLALWELNRDFLQLLASFEAVLPLAEPSQLASRELAPKLHALSNGTIGGVVDVLKDATALALREGRERIDAALLGRLDSVTVANYGRLADRL